jgi:pilus assembly protein CpaE
MDKSYHLLVISSDPGLAAELEDALPSIPGVRFTVQSETDLRRGVELARDRALDLVVLRLEESESRLPEIADAIKRDSPGTHIVAAYTEDFLHGEHSPALIIQSMRAHVTDFLRRPVSPSELAGVLDRQLINARSSGSGVDGAVVSFISNKGGIGKTSVSLSTAVLLAKWHPDRVLLIDASLQLGICGSMLDVEPATGLVDACREAFRLDTTLLRNLTARTKSGLRVLTAPRDAIQAAQVDEAAVARVIGIARRAFDYVIVDTFPAVDAVSMAILDLTDQAYVVTSDLVPIVQSMPAYIDVVLGLGVPEDRLRIVLNQPYPNFSGRLGADIVAERLGRDIDHAIPYSRRLLAAANLGRPYVLNAPSWFGFGKALKKLALEIENLHDGEGAIEIEPARPRSRAERRGDRHTERLNGKAAAAEADEAEDTPRRRAAARTTARKAARAAASSSAGRARLTDRVIDPLTGEPVREEGSPS